MPNLPRIFLDTDAASKLGRLPADQLQLVRKVLGRSYAWRISPLTFAELFIGRDNGSDESWLENSRGLEALHGPGNAPKCFPFPAFALEQAVTGRRRRFANYEPADLAQQLTIAVRARSRDDLRYKHKGGGWTGLDVEVLAKPLREGEATHVERLRGARAAIASGESFDPPPARYGARILKACGITVDDENIGKAVELTDAKMVLDQYLWQAAAGDDPKAYNFEKHRNDWIDSQQLIYLCMSDVHFLTADEKLRRKLESSSQYDRILSFEKACEDALAQGDQR